MEKGLISKKSFNQSLQSYLGILKHCEGYGVGRKIISLVGEKCPKCASLMVFAAKGKTRCSKKECGYEK